MSKKSEKSNQEQLLKIHFAKKNFHLPLKDCKSQTCKSFVPQDCVPTLFLGSGTTVKRKRHPHKAFGTAWDIFLTFLDACNKCQFWCTISTAWWLWMCTHTSPLQCHALRDKNEVLVFPSHTHTCVHQTGFHLASFCSTWNANDRRRVCLIQTNVFFWGVYYYYSLFYSEGAAPPASNLASACCTNSVSAMSPSDLNRMYPARQ